MCGRMLRWPKVTAPCVTLFAYYVNNFNCFYIMFSLFVCFVVVSSNVFKIFEGLLLLGVIFCVWSEHFQ